MQLFAEGLSKFTELKKFNLNLAANDLKDLSALYLSEALGKMQNLKQFSFSFYSSNEVSDKAIEYYGKGISELKNLEKLALQFYK